MAFPSIAGERLLSPPALNRAKQVAHRIGQAHRFHFCAENKNVSGSVADVNFPAGERSTPIAEKLPEEFVSGDLHATTIVVGGEMWSSELEAREHPKRAQDNFGSLFSADRFVSLSMWV